MKKLFIPASMALTAMLLLTGCLELHLGGGSKSEAQYQNPSVGQQLIDLQRAKGHRSHLGRRIPGPKSEAAREQIAGRDGAPNSDSA
jgi:hypothetical protein